MSETWYHVKWYEKKIVPVEVISHTERLVTIQGTFATIRQMRSSGYSQTFEEARQDAISSSQREIDRLEISLKNAKASLKVFMEMNPPEVKP